MKHSNLLFIILLGIALIGCDRKEIENSPFVSLPFGTIFKTTDEVLKIHEYNILDSIAVGDTIVFQASISGVYNNLKELHITSSNYDAVEFIWPRESLLDSLFLPTSNYDEGRFMMDGTHNILYFIFRYVPLKEDKDVKMTFKVISDASPEFNSYNVSLKTPIKAAKKEEGEGGE